MLLHGLLVLYNSYGIKMIMIQAVIIYIYNIYIITHLVFSERSLNTLLL